MLVCLLGCATSSGVFPSGKDTHTVVISGQGGTAMGDMMKRAYQEASSFCDKDKKTMNEVRTTSRPVTYGNPSYFELTFQCVQP